MLFQIYDEGERLQFEEQHKEKHPQTYHHESHTCKRWNSWRTSYAKEETITYIAADITRRSSKNIRRSAEDSSNGYRRTHTESSKNFRRIAALTSTLMYRNRPEEISPLIAPKRKSKYNMFECFCCNRVGHFMKDCWYNPNTNSNDVHHPRKPRVWIGRTFDNSGPRVHNNV